ncbi:CPBP family intramembrane metalloprotease [Xanthomonas campestris]|uniref:CPBP family intramembrane glutamic endopeptidase n=1 Tax=Xanthomonas campestris TaxID=339 RepID=UPI000CDB53B2|nr:type II CAAX endopeptidase family protein [Xanthomonas campestris]TXD44308.1 CPBP family intramembrane metalloprotease [Xanthomonas campestris]
MQEREAASAGWGELLIVVTIAFGLSIWSSVSAVARDAVEPVFSDASLWGMVFYELLVLAILLPVLWFRGWRPQSLGLQWQLRDLAAGLGLLAVCLLVTYPLTLLNWSLGSNTHPFDAMVAGQLSITAVLAISLINPIFEEVFVCGYVIHALEPRHGRAFAVNVSVALRTSYHLYQGPIGAISILAIGLILGWWVARRGRLWPAILAHGALDLLGLMVYT